jgi:16S rRNA (uracil1498-N3)-methyltransferase
MRSAAEAAPATLYLPGLVGSPDRFELPEDEARYVSRVVRARVGETLRASDGAGATAVLVIEDLRPSPRVRVTARARVAAPAPRVLLCGAPEGERGDWMVEKLAELGVTRFVPVETRRSRWPGGDRGARWRRLAVAALRQSRSAWLLECSAPTGVGEALEGLAALPPGSRWLAEAGAPAPTAAGLAAGSLVGAIGGSAGYEDMERDLLREHGFEPVGLARGRLRTETAAVALAAVWGALSGATA